jgi:chromosome segregation ATPase
MRVYKKNMLLVIQLLLVFLLFGCQMPKRPVEITFPSIGLVEEQRPQRTGIEKRFERPIGQGQTAVESAIGLSKKYAELSDEAAELRRKNRELITENARLRDRLATVGPQLKQTQKELREANDLLIEMRVELNNWKADVLGFRGEIRQAEKTQLEALLKILKMLGGEVKAESAQASNAGQVTTPTGRPDQP